MIAANKDENAILMSQAQYDNLMENLHIRDSKANYEWLKESIKQAEDGKLVKFDVEDQDMNVEPLKYDLTGKWSRRITDEHRLVYQVDGENLIVYTCRYHY